MVSARKLPHTCHAPQVRAELGRGKRKKRKIQDVAQRVLHQFHWVTLEIRSHVNVNRGEVQGCLYVKTCCQPVLTLKFFSIKNSSHR